MLKRLLLICFLAGFASAAWSQDFGLDLGCCSEPLTGAPVSVNTNGGGVFDYFNSTNQLITELSFVVNVGTTVLSDPQCTPYSFFSNCVITQNGNFLTFDFHALTPPDGDEDPFHSDPEANETEGIPQLMDGCLAHPDSGYSNPLPLEQNQTFACISRGHFLISFNTPSEGNSVDNPNGFGGWATDGSVSASLATINGVSVPESSPAVLFALGLLAICAIVRRQVRRADQ